jgi:hypothetical protein
MTKTRDEIVELIMSHIYRYAGDRQQLKWDVTAALDALIAAGVIPQHNPDMMGYIMRCPECKEFHARLSCPTPPHNPAGGE